jgi:hypothetical protein
VELLDAAFWVGDGELISSHFLLVDRLLLNGSRAISSRLVQQLARGLALHQQAADEVRGNLLGGAGEEALGEVLGGRGGYWSGLGERRRGDYCRLRIVNVTPINAGLG